MGLMLFIISIWVIAIVGWVLNIVKLVRNLKANQGQQTSITPMFVARCIGVFAAPLGSVLGYIKN